jgi:hypothetical protein
MTLPVLQESGDLRNEPNLPLPIVTAAQELRFSKRTHL